MFDAVDLANVWEMFAADPETVTYYSRSGPDTYLAYGVLAVRLKDQREEVDLSSIVAASASLPWRLWKEWIDSATPLNGAPTQMPDPKDEDYLIASDGTEWTVLVAERKQRLQVFDLDTTNRD